jgi:hypothetical protein
MSTFVIRRSWLPRKGSSEVEVTMCRLQFFLNDQNVSEYRGEHEDGEFLEIPAYFIAEWIAENWWPLLWEPRKSEDAGDDADFLARHSLLTAQHGFALPKLLIVPAGKAVHITASARDVQFADIRFHKSASTWLLRNDVESQLRHFAQEVATRISGSSISNTDLQEAWSLIEHTTDDELPFCRFMGALGLSPYIPNGEVEEVLDRVLPVLGERLTMDLCLASVPQEIDTAAQAAELALAGARSAPESTLEPLAAIAVPSDNASVPAWRRGVEAAKRVRTRLGIKETDPNGASKFFEKLNIDPNATTKDTVQPGNMVGAITGNVVGAVTRESQTLRVALLQQAFHQRRFAAARAAYTAWTSEHKESRLLTLAVTRTQQANRAFAAELTAPVAYLRAHAENSSKLSQDLVFELAANLHIGADVVQKQALNNGLQIVPG